MSSPKKSNWFSKQDVKVRTLLISQVLVALMVSSAFLIGLNLELLHKFASDWQIVLALGIFDIYITIVVFFSVTRSKDIRDERLDFVELKSSKISYQILTNVMALYVLAGLIFKFEHQVVWYLLCSSFLINFVVHKYQQSRI